MTNDALTHADLVRIACRWLAGTKRCPLVFAEPGSMVLAELPDALGFYSSGRTSHVVECKVSRADFRADAKKPFRQPGRGMGTHRWFLVPDGLVQADEVHDGWGLLYVRKGRVRVAVNAASRGQSRDIQSELAWLYSAVHRHQMGVHWFAPEHRFETVAQAVARKSALATASDDARNSERGDDR